MCKHEETDKEKTTAKQNWFSRVIGFILIVFSLLFLLIIIKFTPILIALRNIIKFTLTSDLKRLLICVILPLFGFGIRALIYPLKITRKTPEKPEKEVNVTTRPFILGHIYYAVMLVTISCIIYLSFHPIIMGLSRQAFVALALILFISMGLIVATVIERKSF